MGGHPGYQLDPVSKWVNHLSTSGSSSPSYRHPLVASFEISHDDSLSCKKNPHGICAKSFWTCSHSSVWTYQIQCNQSHFNPIKSRYNKLNPIKPNIVPWCSVPRCQGTSAPRGHSRAVSKAWGMMIILGKTKRQQKTVYVLIRSHIYMIHMCKYTYTLCNTICTYICMWPHIYIYDHMCIYICIYIRSCVYIYIYRSMYIYIYRCICKR